MLCGITGRAGNSEAGHGERSHPKAVSLTAPRTKRQLSKNELTKLRREVADLEEEITLLEADLETMSETMSSGAATGQEMAELGIKTQELQSALEKKMQRWEELTLLLERDPAGGPG